MADHTFRNVIDGATTDALSGESYDVLDPSTGEVYAQAPRSGAEDVDRAYAAAARAFETWGRTTPQERSLALLRIADALESRAEGFVAAECRDTGKPLHLTASEGDATDGGPLPLLRRCLPGHGRQVGGGVPHRPHIVRSS